MQVLHAPAALSAVFDDPNLVSCAGLAPVVALGTRAGLAELTGSHVRVPGEQGANPGLKVPALVAGMVAGADSIDDMDLLRHGGMGRLFGGVRAPSTLGIFLRAFTFGHVRQLDAVASRFLPRLAGLTPILAGAEQITWLDVDDSLIQTYGYAKQAAARGYTGVKGLNTLVATASTPLAAPVIAAARLRRGNARSSRGAATLVAEAVQVIRRCGASGLVIVRADAALYTLAVITTARKAGARFSVTAPLYTSVTKAIAAIPGCLDPDPLPACDLRPNRATLDLRRRGRRNTVHSLPDTPAPARGPGERPFDCAPGTTAQPTPGSRTRRAVPWLPTSRHLHRLAAADAASRSPASAARGHRTGLRRPESWPAGAPAVGSLRRQQCLAGAGRDGV